jgi:AP2-like factor (ANT lineage)
VTNFDMNRYDVKSILESNTLPIGGGAAKRLKEAQAIESSRKREEMIALGSGGFQFGSSSSSSRLQAYPLMLQQQQQQQPFDQPLQNPEISHHHQYTVQDHSFHQSYLQTQLHLHQQSAAASYQNPQFYNGYLQNHPALLQGLMMNMGPSSSVMENNNGGYMGSGLSMASNSTPGNAVGSADDQLALVKVDYDMPSAGYEGWSGDSVQESNPHVFSMWND